MELRCEEITGLDCPVRFSGDSAEEQMSAHLIGSHGIKENIEMEVIEPMDEVTPPQETGEVDFGFKKEEDVAPKKNKRKRKKFGIL